MTAQKTPEKQFGEAVRRAREDLGISQDALAKVLAADGISVGGQSGVARIERGERPTRLNEVVRIARFLSLDLGDLFAVETASRTDGLLTEIRDLLTELVIPVRVERQMLQRVTARMRVEDGDAR